MKDKETMVLRFKYGDQEKLQLPASTETFSTVKEWLGSVLEQVHASSRESKQFLIAADEVFSNIVKHAYRKEDEPKLVEVKLSFDQEKLQLSMAFSDYGVPFDPLKKEAELPKGRIQDHIPGGIGLFLVHQFMDDLSYHREDGRNVLTISKVITPPSAE